ncbi:MAG: TonB-dependent receptor [Paludibacter sp.]|nr:TonB-dependent receptor [Paludibacter sp.]
MNKKTSIIAIFFCLFTISIFSQAAPNVSCTVKGLVLDSVSKESIPYVTISVSSAATPDVYLKRVASDAKGNFELVLNKTGDYMLSFESVGMKKYARNITIASDQKTMSLGKISMSAASKDLAGVTVTALKPLVKVDLDKISYDMKSDPEAQSSNTLDMLRKVPMVTVDGNDNIQLKGSTNFKIYVNGKASGMMTNNPSQVLKSIPASSIKSIEVITDPGAKYDAEGVGGIINIVMDHSLNGLTGTVRSSVNTRGGYNEGLYLSTKKGKFGLTANLNYNNQSQNGQTYDRNVTNFNSQSVKYIHQYANSDAEYRFYYGNLEASYEFDSLNLISLTVGGYNGGSKSVDHAGTNSMNALRDTISAFKQLTSSNNSWGGMDLSLDYQRTFKKPEQLLTISYKLSHTPDNTDNTSDLTGVLNYTSYNQHILYNASGDEHTFQVDYTEPFNKIHVIDVGVKYILRLNNSINNYYLQNVTTDAWEPMPNQPKNNFDQTQNILGAYASYTLKLKKISARAGLRYEQTWSNVIVTDTAFHVNFKNLVPSVTLDYKFNDANNLKLSYTQRISRPGIWYLNPFLDNSNPFSLSQGNPDLNPEINNSFSFDYSYITPKVTLNTSLFTSFTNNSIERVSKSLNDTVTYSTYKNIGKSQYTGLSLYGNWQPNQAVRINLNSNLAYMSMATNDGSGLNNKGFNYSVSLDGEFTLPSEIKLSGYGGYYSARINLQGQSSAFYYYGLSVSRDFLKKKLNVSLSARNPFPERKFYSGYLQTADYREDYTQSYKAQSFGLSVSYRFGELKDQIKKVSKTIENDDVKGGSQSGGGGQ